MLKVFLSSTSSDLGPFREAARDVILSQGWHPVMKTEHGGTDPGVGVLASCVNGIEDCDLVLALIGWKKGSVAKGWEKEGKSYTAWEIESALKLGKPVIVLMAELKGWPEDLQEKEPEDRAWVESFRRTLDRCAVFFDWEEPETIFRGKVEKELLAHRKRITESDVRSSWKALRERWEEREADDRSRIKKRDLEDHPDLPVETIGQLWREWLARPLWHEEVKDQINEIGKQSPSGPRSANLIGSLRSLDLSSNYLVLCEKIKPLLSPQAEEEIQRSIREIETHGGDRRRASDSKHLLALLHQLRRMVTEPNFRRCMLLCGSIGAGKTHRTVHFDADPNRNEEEAAAARADHPTDAPWRSLILWLALGASSQELEEAITKEFNRITGLKCDSLEQIDHCLQTAASQVTGARKTPRLIIVLQDLDRWLRDRRDERLAKLEATIDRTTNLHSFFWVLTLKDTAYDQITGENQERFWQSVSLTPRNDQETEMAGRGLLTGSWVNLDEANREQDLGFGIIAREMPGSSFEALSPEERPRHLANPLIAWTFLKCRDELPRDHAVNLHYIGFVERFWRLRWERLGVPKDGKALAEPELKNVIVLLARAMLEQADLYPEKRRLIERAVALGERLVGCNLREQITQGLNLLKAANLVTVEAVEGGPLGWEERVALRAPFFWYYQLARQLFADMESRSGAGLDEWLAGLAQQCAGFSNEDREGVLEFLLLRAEAPALWRHVLETPELPQAAVWLAAAKASVQAQELAAGFAREHRVRSGERRSLFGFLYFLSEVTAACLAAPERAALLRPLLDGVREANLQSYCLHVLGRIFQAVRSQEEWLETVSALAGCEPLEKTGEIGEMAARRAAELIEQDGSGSLDLLRLFVRYLQTEHPETRGDAIFTPWRRHFLREWILCFGFDHLVSWKQRDKAGPAALFNELFDMGWYDPARLKVTRRVGREMEQEANIALGWWYRHSPRQRHELVEVVQKLVDSPDVRDHQLAFFLMRHTGGHDQNGALLLDRALDDALSRIASDPGLAWLHEKSPFRTELEGALPAPAAAREEVAMAQ